MIQTVGEMPDYTAAVNELMSDLLQVTQEGVNHVLFLPTHMKLMLNGAISESRISRRMIHDVRTALCIYEGLCKYTCVCCVLRANIL